MFPQRFTVICHDRDQSVVIFFLDVKCGEEFAQYRIGVSDFSVVRLRSVSFFERGGRIIGIVRIVEMHPNEERALGMFAHPIQRTTHHIFCPALYRLVTIGATGAHAESRAVHIETSIKTGRSAIQRIEYQGPYKRRRLVALLT